MSRNRSSGDAYYPTLDGWRAIAIAGVTVAHVSFPIFRAGGTSPNAAALNATRYGALGVDVFFGISGFLICSRLLKELQRTGRLNLRRFYIRRVFRILPPYLATLLTVALAGAIGVLPLTRGEFWTCLLFVRNYLPTAGAESGWYTGHFWSLSVEEHFYLLFPMLLAMWQPRGALRYTPIVAMAIAVWRVVEFRLGLVSSLLPAASFYERSDVRMDALLWGCFVAIALSDPERRARYREAVTPFVWCVLVALYVGCIAMRPPLAMAFEAVLIPLILAGTVLRPEMFIGRLLETRVFRWVGRLSYSLYLWQTPFMAPTVPSPLGSLQLFPLNVIGLIATAAASYYVIERPMIALGRRLSSDRAMVAVPMPLAASSEATLF